MSIDSYDGWLMSESLRRDLGETYDIDMHKVRVGEDGMNGLESFFRDFMHIADPLHPRFEELFRNLNSWADALSRAMKAYEVCDILHRMRETFRF